MTNRNTLVAHILVDELARTGLRHVCLAPGSRNTPLVLAFVQHPAIQVSSHLDERSAAFFALGIGLADARPAAVVCTSGSAAANFFPAVVEAHQAGVPLLVLTADRPHEVRDSGANQTIDQVGMFGRFVLWSVDVALPEAVPPALVVRNLRTLAARALATAMGLRRGVVHLNLPFRAPLEPTPLAGDLGEVPPDAAPRARNAPQTIFAAPVAAVPDAALAQVAELMGHYKRGLIVCGPHSPGGRFGALVAELARRSGYPALADGTSGLRLGQPGLLGGYDTFLSGQHAFEPPEVVVRCGAVPTSKALNQYLDSGAVQAVVQIRADGIWADDSHRTSHFIQANEEAFVAALLAQVVPHEGAWAQRWAQAEATTWQSYEALMAKQPLFDGAAVYDLLDLLPDGTSLFVGNSLAVRHLDQYARPGTKRVAAFANRGASGIDGNLSTALGIGRARPDGPLVALVGDITFYHDMNGLLAVRRCGVPVTIVLLHNDGGGIFHRLPISRFEPEFTPYFATPHGLDFAPTAQIYGLTYVRVRDREHFRSACSASIVGHEPTIIEVRSDASTDLARRQELLAAVRARYQNHALAESA